MNLPALQRKCMQGRAAIEPHVPTLNAPTFRELRNNRVVEVRCLRRISCKAFRIILMKQAINYIRTAPHGVSPCNFFALVSMRLCKLKMQLVIRTGESVRMNGLLQFELWGFVTS